jgi:hypothetical protein
MSILMQIVQQVADPPMDKKCRLSEATYNRDESLTAKVGVFDGNSEERRKRCVG